MVSLVWALCLFAPAWPAAGVSWAEHPQAGHGPLAKIRVAAGGRTLETADGRPFVPMGVNYYRPGTGWAPQLWKKFDPEATRRDFARMKELGVNCVRVFLTYGSFFMEPDRLSADGLAKFDRLLEIAESAGIYLHPTGPDHWEGIPPWAATDRIADEKVLAALETFWKLFAKQYRGKTGVFAYDLLNEPSVAWDTPAMREKWKGSQPPPSPKDSPGGPQLLAYQHFREEIADAWTRRQTAAIKAADPQALVTVGMIQWSVPSLLPGVQHYAAFRPQRQAKFLDFLEVHFYPLAAGFYEYARPEDETVNLAYLESVVREVAAAGKPVVVAEFGWYGGGKLGINRGSHPAATEEQQARWCRRAIETTEGLATGWLNWGFYDHPEARDVSQLTGLLTVDGKPKAWAREFRAQALRLAGKSVAPAVLGPRPPLDWDRLITSPKAGQEFREAYLQAFQSE
jgi:hypothetical protein